MAAFDTDLARWCQDQVVRLREIAGVGHVLLPGLDLENVAEEVEAWSGWADHELFKASAEAIGAELAAAYAYEAAPAGLIDYWRWRRRVARNRVTALVTRSPSLTRLFDRAGLTNDQGRNYAGLFFHYAGFEPPAIPMPGYTLEDLLNAEPAPASDFPMPETAWPGKFEPLTDQPARTDYEADFAAWAEWQAEVLRGLEADPVVGLAGLELSRLAQAIGAWSELERWEAFEAAVSFVAYALARQWGEQAGVSRKLGRIWGELSTRMLGDIEMAREDSPSLWPWLEARMPRINEVGRQEGCALFTRVMGITPPLTEVPEYQLADLEFPDL